MRLTKTEVKVADEVFVATALLQRENPRKEDFTIGEIVERVKKENLFGDLRPGVRVHASLHCVANRPPNPGRYAMLYATGGNTRRLLLAEDDVHAGRTGKIFPDPEDVPPQYRELIQWAKRRFGTRAAPARTRWLEGAMQLFGAGREMWKGEDPDEYVRRLRKGWD